MVSSVLLIRPATGADLPRLSVLWRELMDLHQTRDPRFALATNATHRWSALAEEIIQREDAFLFVALDGERTIGFCLGWVARNPAIYRLTEVGFISEIAVAQDARRHGVGTALIREAVRFFESRSIPEFQLSTAEWNDEAKAFWQSLGGELLLLRYRFPLTKGAENVV